MTHSGKTDSVEHQQYENKMLIDIQTIRESLFEKLNKW